MGARHQPLLVVGAERIDDARGAAGRADETAVCGVWGVVSSRARVMGGEESHQPAVANEDGVGS